VKGAALALAAMTTATLALAQQTAPPTTTEPRTSTTPQERAAPPARSRSRTLSAADKQALMRNCLQQVQADNPGVPAKDVKDDCDKAVKSSSALR
jgi:hypothetical protein